jgi:D-alanyl-D-alanine carboxypeptidase
VTHTECEQYKKVLDAEREHLINIFLISDNKFHFVDGSSGGEISLTLNATIKLLNDMSNTEVFDAYKASLTILGVDGSLVFVDEFEKNSDLKDAKGNVFAKTGTFIETDDSGGIVIRAQAFAGYIDAKTGRRLMYALFVNNVRSTNLIDDIVRIFQDEGMISAIIWKEN